MDLVKKVRQILETGAMPSRDLVECLCDRIKELETEIGGSPNEEAHLKLGLSPTESKIFSILEKKRTVRASTILTMVYGNRLDCEVPWESNVRTHIHNMRKKLRQQGVEIINKRGHGYTLEKPEKMVGKTT